MACHKLEIENPNGGKHPRFETAKNAAGYVYCGQFARMSAMFTQQLRGNDIHYQPIYDFYNLSDSKLTNTYNTAYRHGIALSMDRAKEYDKEAASYPETEVQEITESKLKADDGRLLAACIYSILIEYFYNAEWYIGRGISPSALTYDSINGLLDDIVTPEYSDEVKLLKTRLLVNQERYNEALSMINSIGNLDDVNYSVAFKGTSTNSNEWVQFTGARGGYLSADSVNIVDHYMVDDPRLPLYYLSNTSFNFPMSRNLMKIPLIGNLEGYFLMAELKVRMGDITGAEDDYKKGIIESMTLSGVSNDSTYLQTNGSLVNNQEGALAQVMKEKYLALFGHPLVFVDYKRTKLPLITEKPGVFPDKWTYFYQ